MPLSDKTILDSHCFIHELKREMNDDLEYVNSLEKELDELESEKADFSNIYDLLLEECVSKDVTCSYLHSLSDLNANTELKCMYLHKVKECECLAQKLSKRTESVNKEVHTNLLKSFSKLEKHSISLELSLQHFTQQSLPQNRNQAIRNTNVLKPGMFRIASTTAQNRTPQLPHASRNTNPHMSKSSGVIHRTSVSRPQLKSYQKSKSYYKKLYENTNQEWKWWIAKRCPSVYTWTQKPLRTKKIWMPKIRKMMNQPRISPTNKTLLYNSSYSLLTLDAQIQASVINVYAFDRSDQARSSWQCTSAQQRSELGIQGPQNGTNAEDISHKVVRLGINPMIQPEPEDLPKDNPKLEIAVLSVNGILHQRTLTCYECGNQGHYKSDCPELKNRNHGNQAEGTEARGMVGPFKVLEQVESVAYKLKLPQELSRVHNTFHVSNLKKCYSDDPYRSSGRGLQVDNKLHFVEEPVEIMDREVKQLRRSRVPIVKVRWNSRRGPEFTWEREDQFRKKYPHLFTKIAPSSSAVS
ncbi:retrovirus-related pol polyprotein from transposon TNT 1-94 [Tanacetum coccineum]